MLYRLTRVHLEETRCSCLSQRFVDGSLVVTIKAVVLLLPLVLRHAQIFACIQAYHMWHFDCGTSSCGNSYYVDENILGKESPRHRAKNARQYMINAR